MTESIAVGTNYIVKTPGFRDGEPYVAGRHISVEFIASLYVNHGLTAEEIAKRQELTPAQTHAALSYYYDHPEEIQAIWAEQDRLVAERWPSDKEQAIRREELIQRMKERDPERYERFMQAHEESGKAD
jgi:uncharacterized protein (DUF433 family)